MGSAKKKRRGDSGKPLPIRWALPFSLSLPVTLWCLAVVCVYYSDPYFLTHISRFAANLPPLWKWTPQALGRELSALIFIFWMAALGTGMGYFLFARIGLKFNSGLEALTFRLGAGLGGIGLGLLILGLARLWHGAVIFTILAALTPPALIGVKRSLQEAYAAPPPFALWERCACGLLILAAGLYLVGSFSPETSYDALVYHLALPERFWLKGGISRVPGNLFSGMPLLIQMLYAPGILAGLEETSHILNWLLAAATAGALLAASLRLSGKRTAGIIAGLIFFSQPLVAIFSFKASVEIGWTFFQFLSVYALAARFDPDESARRWTVVSGIFAGLAMGAKYPAWPMAALLIPILLLFLRQSGRSWRESLRETALFAGVAGLVAAAWPVKNLIIYGNPLYPFFDEFFNAAPNPLWRTLLADGHQNRGLREIFISWRGLGVYLAHPWTDLARGTGDVSSMGVLIFLTLPLITLTRFRPGPAAVIKTALLLQWLTWSLYSSLPRLFLPVTPLAGLTAGLAVEALFPRRLKSAVCAAVLAAAAVNLTWSVYWQKEKYDLWESALGTRPVQEHLDRMRHAYPVPPNPAIRYINDELPAEAKVLFLPEARVFRMRRDSLTATVFDRHPLRDWLNESGSVEDLYRHYRANKVTHQFTSGGDLARRERDRGNPPLPFDDPEKMLLYHDFEAAHLKEVFDHTRLSEDGRGLLTRLKVYKVIP